MLIKKKHNVVYLFLYKKVLKMPVTDFSSKEQAAFPVHHRAGLLAHSIIYIILFVLNTFSTYNEQRT